jgi:subtilisin family serine protease
VESLGVTITKSFAFRPVLGVRLAPGQLERLLASEWVDYVEADLGGRLESSEIRAVSNASVAGQDTSWAVQRVGAPSAWTQNQGQAVTVTMLDGGLDYTHTITGDGPASLGMCLYDATIPEDEPGCTAPASGGFKPQAHASFVAGLVNARDNDDGGIGVAPVLLQFNSIRVCKRTPDYSCPPSALVHGLDWAISQQITRHVVNISIGYCHNSISLQSAIQSAVQSGILVIAAAGNRWLDDGDCPANPSPTIGISEVMYPARYTGVLAVAGSMYDNGVPPLLNRPAGGGDPWERPPCDEIVGCAQELQGLGSIAAGDSLCLGYGSRTGPQVAVVAPFWSLSMAASGKYRFGCGTSFASPIVSGAAALVWTRQPSYTSAQVRTHLLATAVTLSGGRKLAFAGLELPALTVVMGGPQEIDTEGTYTWTATPPTYWPNPIDYTWHYSESSLGPWELVGSGASYFRYVSASSPAGFWVRVTATSGSSSVWSMLFVSNSAVNPCYPYDC